MTLISPEVQPLERMSQYKRRLLRKGLAETAQAAAKLHTDLLSIAQFEGNVGPNFPLTYRLAGSLGTAGKTIHAKLGVDHDIFLNSDGVHAYGPHVPLDISIERSLIQDQSMDTIRIWDIPKGDARTRRSLGLVAYTRTPADIHHFADSQVELITGEENGYANDPEAQLDLIRADLETLEGFVRY